MKKLSNQEKVMRYIRKNPNAKAKEVAQAVGVSIATVYQSTYKAKKKVNGQTQTVLLATSDSPIRGKLSEEDFKKLRLPRIAYDDYGNIRQRIANFREAIQDNVNHPAHYKTGGIETIDFIEAKALNYNLGNVVKYITRAGVKDKTKHIEDLEKGAWYLKREIFNLRRQK